MQHNTIKVTQEQIDSIKNSPLYLDLGAAVWQATELDTGDEVLFVEIKKDATHGAPLSLWWNQIPEETPLIGFYAEGMENIPDYLTDLHRV